MIGVRDPMLKRYPTPLTCFVAITGLLDHFCFARKAEAAVAFTRKAEVSERVARLNEQVLRSDQVHGWVLLTVFDVLSL
jgi:hypothetical protein